MTATGSSPLMPARGRMRLIATIEDPVIRQILAPAGLSTEIPSPPRPPARTADLLLDLSV